MQAVVCRANAVLKRTERRQLPLLDLEWRIFSTMAECYIRFVPV